MRLLMPTYDLLKDLQFHLQTKSLLTTMSQLLANYDKKAKKPNLVAIIEPTLKLVIKTNLQTNTEIQNKVMEIRKNLRFRSSSAVVYALIISFPLKKFQKLPQRIRKPITKGRRRTSKLTELRLKPKFKPKLKPKFRLSPKLKRRVRRPKRTLPATNSQERAMFNRLRKDPLFLQTAPTDSFRTFEGFIKEFGECPFSKGELRKTPGALLTLYDKTTSEWRDLTKPKKKPIPKPKKKIKKKIKKKPSVVIGMHYAVIRKPHLDTVTPPAVLRSFPTKEQAKAFCLQNKLTQKERYFIIYSPTTER